MSAEQNAPSESAPAASSSSSSYASVLTASGSSDSSAASSSSSSTGPLPAPLHAVGALKPFGHPDGYHVTLLVIGKVTENSARVLVEVLEDGELTCSITCTRTNVRKMNSGTAAADADDEKQLDGNDGNKKDKAERKQAADEDGLGVNTLPLSQSATRKMLGGRPRVFHFNNLEPNARYTVTFSALAHAQPASSFTTLMADWKVDPSYPPFRYATVSCNLLSETLALRKGEQVDLWQDLADRIARGEIDYVLHIGDQVYADEPRSNDDVAPQVSAFDPEAHQQQGQGWKPIKDSQQLIFKRALKVLTDKGSKTFEEHMKYAPLIEELYREIYRETWSHPATAAALANAPNLSIYDDHDYVDNWGSRPEHRERDGPFFAIGTCARKVYWEYQGSLHSDVDLERVPAIERDHHFHVFGEYGLAFTESRSALTFRYDPADKTPFMGALQWRDLERACSLTAPDADFKHVRHLLIICPVPVVYLPHALNSFSEPMCEDAQGHWASAPFRDEQTRMLNMALAWQEGKESFERCATEAVPEQTGVRDSKEVDEARKMTTFNYPHLVACSSLSPPDGVCSSARRVTFVGGDVHVGGHTRLYKHGHLVLEQLVSSAIANHILPQVAFWIGSIIQNAYTQLNDGWSYQHQEFTRNRNYGLITVNGNDQGGKKALVHTAIISAE